MSDVCCQVGSEHAHDSERATAVKVSNRSTGLLLGAGVAIVTGAFAAALGATVIARVEYLLAIALAIVPPARAAWRAVRAGSLDINVLMVIAVAGAIALDDWMEGAVVVFLFGVAEWIEAASLRRARSAIGSLMAMAPTEALVRRDGSEMTIAASEVRVGDTMIVRPGARVVADGRVVAGVSAMNQAPVTGESWPVDKAPGDIVLAGSINGTGALEIEASRIAADSTLARIVHLVEQAQAKRAPVQTFVDRFARLYTPAVALLALTIALVPPLLAGGSFGDWTYRALALLVVACPCALVLSTPVAIVSAIAAAARAGVLIKGGAPLERLAGIRCMAFDKTGTLTDGRVTVTDVLGVEGVSSHGVLSVAAALEMRSEHPIGRAIVQHAAGEGLEFAPGMAFRALPGFGAEATVSAGPAIIGSHRLFEERRLCTPSLHERIDAVTERGGTPVLVGHHGAALGVIGLSDRMRAGGHDVIRDLRAQGVARLVLLTGDSADRAAHAVSGAGLDEIHAGLLPHDKVALVASLRAEHGPVAMVGDGVNDAPALAAADVGIAMGVAGTDVALETADVALMSDDLSKLPFALSLGRATLRNIRANVSIALGLKLAFVVLATFGVATLWMAVLADTGASVLVTANSLRLLRGPGDRRR